MNDHPEYSISEFIAASFLFGAGLVALVWALHSYMEDEIGDLMVGLGAALLFLSGCADPKKYFVDFFTFPMRFAQSAGRDTPLTTIASILGFLLCVAGWLFNVYA
jgi:hypothetical protein